MEELTLLLNDRFQFHFVFGTWEELSEFYQVFEVALDELHIILLGETLLPFGLHHLHALLAVIRNPRIEEVSSDDEGGPSLASVAMDQSFPSTFDDKIHHLGHIQSSAVAWIGEVFPIKIEKRNPVLH